MTDLSGLYAITDAGLMPPPQFAERAEQALRNGARIIQYRDKSADQSLRRAQAALLRALSRRYQALLLINDDVELAAEIEADGVHLGRDDAAYASARQRLGQRAVIGLSCYNQWQRAVEAQALGANYVAFGRFYPSLSKPHAVPAELELLRRAKRKLRVPVAAIGGITLDNAAPLLAAGADMLAVIQGLFGTDDIGRRARDFAQLFSESAAAMRI